MATFLYECKISDPTDETKNLGHGEFEEEHSIHSKLEHCPHCAKNGVVTEVKRLISCLSKGTVELYGQDLVDKVKADAQQLKKEMYQKEDTYANLLGIDKYESIQKRMDRQKQDRKNY